MRKMAADLLLRLARWLDPADPLHDVPLHVEPYSDHDPGDRYQLHPALEIADTSLDASREP